MNETKITATHACRRLSTRRGCLGCSTGFMSAAMNRSLCRGMLLPPFNVWLA